MQPFTLLSNRDAVNLAQLRDALVGSLNTGQAELINEVIYVDGTNGSNSYDGKRPDRAKKTIAGGLAAAAAYDVVAVFPGTYAEHLTMSTANVTLLGLGVKARDVVIRSAVDDATTFITITGSNCTVSNLRIQHGHANNTSCIDVQASDTLIEGVQFVKYASIVLDVGVKLTGPDTNLNNAIVNCLFDGHTIGISFVTSTTTAKQTFIVGCTFLRGVTADIKDGGAAVSVEEVHIRDCNFLGAPTDFMILTAGTSTGTLVNCNFNYATFEADVITIDTGILTVRNATVAGIATAAPA